LAAVKLISQISMCHGVRIQMKVMLRSTGFIRSCKCSLKGYTDSTPVAKRKRDGVSLSKVNRETYMYLRTPSGFDYMYLVPLKVM
jgi:hypothetical protein